MRRVGTVLIASAMLVVACDKSPLSPSDLLGASWRLVSLQQGAAAPVAVADGSRYTLQFSGNDRVSIKSDCNSCSGTYLLNGSSLAVGALACTRAFCGEESLDSPFVDALQRARTVSLSGDALVVEGEGMTLRFAR